MSQPLVRMLQFAISVAALFQFLPLTQTASADDVVASIDSTNYYCPQNWEYSTQYHMCTNGTEALGPFPPRMVELCRKNGGGPACDNVTWGADFAFALRGSALCPTGSSFRPDINVCTDDVSLYGPFSKAVVTECQRNAGGPACEGMRWGAAVLAQPLPKSLRLNVPYFYQYNNLNAPAQTCNLTALAMSMTYLGTNKTSDQLFSRVRSPVYQGFGLVSMARIYGLDGIYRQDASRELIQSYLARGLPVLLQGWFSAEGHFIVLTGYDETGWWVNDPAGVWKGCTTCGYLRDATRGKQIHYSYEAVQKVAADSGRPNSYWITVITK